MQEATRNAALDLIRCAKSMQEASNRLWWAQNPDESVPEQGDPPTVEAAQEAQSESFIALGRAVYYMEKALKREGRAAQETSVRCTCKACGGTGYVQIGLDTYERCTCSARKETSAQHRLCICNPGPACADYPDCTCGRIE